MKIIRTKQSNIEYQYSAYKPGWVFEVVNDFGEYYTAKVLSGSTDKTDHVIAVHKNDCEVLTLGSYTHDKISMKL
tara:strand:- start:266 stop:490 length:225 start_codon:yes stop_codon:yes gene_type:complete